MIKFLWQINLRRVGRYFKKAKAAKIITVVLFVLVFCAVAFGIYRLFYSGFLYLKTYPFFRPALTLYSFEIFFLLIGFLIWLGSMISLLFGLFKNPRSNFILASPKFGALPIYNLYSTLASSAWILLFVLAPALWAGIVVFNTGFLAFVLALLACLMLIAFAVLLAYLGVLGLAYLWRLLFKSGPKFFQLAIVLAISTIAAFGVVAVKVSHHDIIVILSSTDLTLTQAPLGPVLQSFKFLPTGTAAQIVTYTQLGELSQTLHGFITLGLLIIIEMLLAWGLGKVFLPLWQNLSEGGGVAHSQEARRRGKVITSSLLNRPFGAVLYKERTQLFRNPKNSFWLMFLLLLWLSYIGFTLSIQTHLQKSSNQLTQLPNIILSIQLLVLVYFVSALVLRFVFPSFSAERNTAWILASSPLRLGRLLVAKFWFFAITFCGFALIAQAVNIFLLKLPLGQGGLFLALGLTTVLALCSLGLYFGVKFANFETDDPQALGTSIPGLIFMACAVLYGALCAFVYYIYLTASFPQFPIIFILASLLLTAALLSSAASAASHTDFTPEYN